MSEMLKSSGAMAVATLSSRITGFVRHAVFAWLMGAGTVASAFALAFQIPNLFRRLLGEGALSAAFIPIFKEKERTAGEKEMWASANAVISGLFLVASALVLLVVGILAVVLALGWGSRLSALTGPHAGDTVLMLRLLQVMFPYMLLVCLAAIFIGMLNARGRFFAPAMGTTILNLVMIASVFGLALWLGRSLEEQIFGVATGVVLAGIAQAVYQRQALQREGYQFAWVSPWRNPTVREVVRKMVPGMLGVAAFQINVLLTSLVAFYVDGKIVASFDYAVRLMELPQGMFGISLATYLLPTLSGLAVDRNFGEFRRTLHQAIGYLVFINLIASVILLMQAEPIIRLLFERGRFTPAHTAAAASALTFLAPGLIVFSLVNILARAFYAVGDTRTPMRISMVCLAINLVLAMSLIGPFRQAGLAIANTVTSTINLLLLLRALRGRIPRGELTDGAPVPATPGAVSRNWVLGVAIVVAGAVLWFSMRLWQLRIGHSHLGERMGEVFVPMLLAGAVYLGICYALDLPAAREVFAFIRRRKPRASS